MSMHRSIAIVSMVGALAVSAPASAAVTLTLNADSSHLSKTDPLAISDSVSSGKHLASGSASFAAGQVSAHASGAQTTANAALSASFVYAVAGATVDTITPVTFTFTDANTAGSGGTTGSAGAYTFGSLYDGDTQLYSFISTFSGMQKFTYNLVGSSGSLILNLNTIATGASYFYNGYNGLTEVPVSADSTLAFDVTRPQSVGYVLQALPVVAAVPEPATWGMMILGMGIVGGVMRRRQKVRTTVQFV